MLGLDFASIDGNVAPDFKKVKSGGARYVIMRASFGTWDTRNRAWRIMPDPAFQRDWERIPKAKLVRGAYMFPVLQAPQTPKEQVAVFVDSISKAGGLDPHKDFPPVLDVEFPGGIKKTKLSRQGALEWIREAASLIKGSFGVQPMIYTSARVWDSEDDDALDADRKVLTDLIESPLWLARYPYKARKPAVLTLPTGGPPVPKMWGADNYWFWQYQGDALKMPGFSSTVDLNKFHIVMIGDKGPIVKWIQKKVGATVDGDFGPATAKAVKRVQGKHGLVMDGIIGPATFAAISWY